MENFLTAQTAILLSAIFSGCLGCIGLLIKKSWNLQERIGEISGKLSSKNPFKLNLHVMITIFYVFSLVGLALWVSFLVQWLSLQFGVLHPISLILYVITLFTFGFLVLIFYEDLRILPTTAFKAVSQEPSLSLSLSITFLFVVTIIYGYSLSTATVPSSVPVASMAPHNPQAYYFHLILLICPLFLILTKEMTFKDMGFVFKKDTLTKGLLMGAGFLFLIPLFYLQAFLLPGTLDIKMGVPFLYFITAIAIGPVSEEIFFIGILQTKFQNVRGISGGLALFLSSLANAFFHIPEILFAPNALLISKQLPLLTSYLKHPAYYPFIAFFYFFFLSLYFGDVYRTTKSIYWPILAHSILNIILFTLIIS